MENEDRKRERIELIVHDRMDRPPFEAPNEIYISTFPPRQDTLASRAITAV